MLVFHIPNYSKAVSKGTKDTPMTAKHNFGFPRTTSIPIRDFFLDDELRQPF